MKKILVVFIALFFINFLNADDDSTLILKSSGAYSSIMQQYTGQSKLVKNSSAILIYPSVKKMGFVIGGMFGKGVALIRENGNLVPYYSEISNASLGLQIGYEDNGTIIFVMDPKLVDSMRRSKFSVGADVTASIWKASANIGSINVFSKQMYIFMDKSGVFAGISIGGSVISINNKLNSNGYELESLINTINKE